MDCSDNNCKVIQEKRSEAEYFMAGDKGHSEECVATGYKKQPLLQDRVKAA
jgi:hypothetical protein